MTVTTFNVGDRVAYADNPNQTGTVTHIYPEGIIERPGYGINWDADDDVNGIWTARSLTPAPRCDVRADGGTGHRCQETPGHAGEHAWRDPGGRGAIGWYDGIGHPNGGHDDTEPGPLADEGPGPLSLARQAMVDAQTVPMRNDADEYRATIAEAHAYATIALVEATERQNQLLAGILERLTGKEG